jgi:hypothetical protein
MRLNREFRHGAISPLVYAAGCYVTTPHICRCVRRHARPKTVNGRLEETAFPNLNKYKSATFLQHRLAAVRLDTNVSMSSSVGRQNLWLFARCALPYAATADSARARKTLYRTEKRPR